MRPDVTANRGRVHEPHPTLNAPPLLRSRPILAAHRALVVLPILGRLRDHAEDIFAGRCGEALGPLV
jgi:hypothetical protein